MNRYSTIALATLSLGAWAGCFDAGKEGQPPTITTVVQDWRDEVVYQVLIDRFSNGDANNDFNVKPQAAAAYHGGDYQGLIDRLDYLGDLGVTALWISPVVKNVEEDAGVGGYHGYWAQDFTEVNPHFGDMPKLRELVAAAHARNMKVILDIVTNHVGQLFYYDINRNGEADEQVMGSGTSSPITRTTEWDPDFDERGVQSFTSLGPSGRAPINWVWQPEINRVPPWPAEFANPDWYNRMGRVTVWGREKQACLDAGRITAAERDSGTGWAGLPACYEYVRMQEVLGDFPGGLKDLRTELPEVRQALINAYAYWIGQAGFDGFRIDTIKHVEDDFWRTFCPAIRRQAAAMGKHNFLMFGEAFDGDDKLIGGYTRDDMLDSVFYFSQKFVIDDVFKNGAPTRRLEDLWKARIPGQDQGQVLNYGTNPQTGGVTDAAGTPLPPWRLTVNFLDNHDLPRYLYQNLDRPGLHSALALLLTMDGIPCLYYGTEQDFAGGNDPANREDLWASGFATDGDTFAWIRQLSGLRRQLASLRRGDMKVVWSSTGTGAAQDAGILAFERTIPATAGSAADTVLVVLNTSATNTAETSADLSGGGNMITSFAAGTRLVNLLDEQDPTDDVTVGTDGAVRLRLQPRTAKVFVVR
jgi:glycosidase